MPKEQQTNQSEGIEFTIVYSGRRTLGITVLPDATVVVRAPYRASMKTIRTVVEQKAAWIIKHRDSYNNKKLRRLNGSYASGEPLLFRGKEYVLHIIESGKPFIHFNDSRIDLGLDRPEDPGAVKRLIYKEYKSEASKVFPEILEAKVKSYENQMFKPTGLVIRSMKSRWGSCSKKGLITLSTELIKLPDIFIEYVIVHELCHLKHHNHGKEYYKLLSELFPDWKKVRRDLRDYIH